MNPFIYENPTKMRFGIGCTDSLSEEICRFGTSVLFLYGGGSIHQNGVYDTVRRQLEISGCSITEHGGVVGNPRLSHARAGVELVRENAVDLIVAVGGGSVIDEAKAIAAGSLYSGDLWDFYSRKAVISRALPIISVLTLPATASEMNGFSVLTNDTTLEKCAIGASPILNPKVSFCDPSFTTSISLTQTGFAAADIIAHLTEGYFTTTSAELLPQDELIEGAVRSVIAAVKAIREDPSNIEARSSVMWTASLAWNGTLQAGIPGALLPCHALEMPLSGIYDIAHGAGLAILTPHWMRALQPVHGSRICRFGERVLGAGGSVEQTASAMEKLYRELGAPLSMREVGIAEIDRDKLVTDAVLSFKQRGISGYSREIVEEIYRGIV